MLPEMFCRAYDWALRPETAVVRASKIPMTVLHSAASGRRTDQDVRGRRNPRRASQAACQMQKAAFSGSYTQRRGRAQTPPGKIRAGSAENAGPVRPAARQQA